ACVIMVAWCGVFSSVAVAQEKVLADEVAAIVGHNTILLSDIERQALYITEQRKQEGTLSTQTAKEEAFELLLLQNVLSQRARLDSVDKELPPIDDMVEQEMNRMIKMAGGIKALEHKQGKPVYQIRSTISRQVQDMQLAQLMRNKIYQRSTITYDEVAAFAERIPEDSMQKIPIQYSFSKIVKIPPQTEERKYAIRERLLEYRRRILSGEKMSVLARLYSMDGSAVQGGEMGPQDIHSFVGPFAAAIEELKPGQVSEIVETEYGLHIIELISYKDGLAHVRHILLKPEFTVEESERVVTELDSLANEIRNKKIDFAKAAFRYSDDVNSKENGGKSFNVAQFNNTGDIRLASSRYMPDELAPFDSREIRTMSVGEISAPYESVDNKGNIVRQIVRMDEIIPAHNANINQDYDILESFALHEKQSKDFNRWLDATIKAMYIEITPAFAGYKFEHKVFESKKK
ncbi:MAG: peptidylprolyl isomerase, partial [Mucinivorans sp.]